MMPSAGQCQQSLSGFRTWNSGPVAGILVYLQLVSHINISAISKINQNHDMELY